MTILQVTVPRPKPKLNYNLAGNHASQVTTVIHKRKKWLRMWKRLNYNNFFLLKKKRCNVLIGLKSLIGWYIIVDQLFHHSRTSGKKTRICSHLEGFLNCLGLLCYTNNLILRNSMTSKQSILLIDLFHVKLSAC